MDADRFAADFTALVETVERTVLGQRETVEMALTCMLANGHLLIEDNPGVGKTTLARALAGSIDASMKRIQFTPDLLPTDITGTDVEDPETKKLVFRHGPVFATVVLADEINRASPKTQSALLQAMQEREVTFGSNTYSVLIDPKHPLVKAPKDGPYLVLATQNPLDAEGTYALPAAQLDRFLMKIHMDYPDLDAERRILRMHGAAQRAPVSAQRISLTRVTEMMREALEVTVDVKIEAYVLDIVRATRDAARSNGAARLRLGASPRGSIGLLRAAQVRAAAHKRDYTLPEDVKDLAPVVLTHRLVPSYATVDEPADVLADILRRIHPR